MRSGLQSETEFAHGQHGAVDGDDMVLIGNGRDDEKKHELRSEDDDSDNSLNRLADKRNSIEKLKSQLIYD